MDIFSDTTKDRRLRRELVKAVQRKGISDLQVLHAMLIVPRHLFMPADLRPVAYEDKPFPIGEGQSISQPYTVAYQTQLLEVKVGDKVLEVGTGSKYQACILSIMGANVYTIERQKKLFERTDASAYMKQCPNVRLFYGDGYKGLPEHGPFDKILVTAAAPVIPPQLVEQLAPGGTMVVPVGAGDIQTMIRIRKKDSEEIEESYSLVPSSIGTKEKLLK